MDAAKKSVLLTIGLFLCSSLMAAEPTAANIFGTVQRKDGTALPGVNVTATSLGLAGELTVMTGGNGSFNLLDLAPGVYTLSFVLNGYKSVARKSIALGMEQTRFLKVTMKPGKSENAVAMAKKVPWNDVKSAGQGKRPTKNVFQSLPRGRNFDSLLNIIPGISGEVLLLGGTSVHGASGLENRYFIDGADTTSIMDGSPGQNVSFDFVDEVWVNDCGCPAASSGSLGGVINVVTRSGGNEFHGEIIGYYSGAPLRSKYRDILSLDYHDESKAIYYPYSTYYGVDNDLQLEAGLNLGGYILKDKLWFFIAFSPSYYKNDRTVTEPYHDSDYKEIWKRTEKQMNLLFKLTSQPIKNLRLGASVVNNFYKYKGDLDTAFTIYYNNRIPLDKFGFSYPNLSGNFSAELILGKTMLNARAGYFRTNQNNQLYQPGDEPYVSNYIRVPGGNMYKTSNIGLLDIPPAYYIMGCGYAGCPPRPATLMRRNIAEKLSVGFDLSYFMDLGGEHSWKGGFSWARRGQDVDNSYSAPVILLGWDRDFIAYNKDYGRGKYGYYEVLNNDVTGPYGDFYKAYGNMFSIYLQDSWTIANRLTVNFGVRAGSEYVPSYATGNPDFESLKPIRFDLGDKIAPRLGFVWDVKGDSSLKVFGSYGIYYDDMKLKMAAAAFGGSKWKSTYYALDTYKWDEIGVNNYFPGRPLLPAPYTFDFRVPSFDSIDPGLKPMAQREISLGLEKRLLSDLAMSVRLVNKHLVRAIENVGVLMPEGEKYYITNPGGAFIKGKYAEAKAAGLMPQTAPDCPEARRDYYGLSIALDKRFAANWLGGISYTFSSLRGNYNGLASGDEVGRTDYAGRKINRTAPYVEQYFDSWYVSRKLDLSESVGPLSGDRPHHFKAYGSYSFPLGITAGIVANAMSGTPTSTEWVMGHRNLPYGSTNYPGYMPYGRGDKARAPFLWFANFYVEYNLKLGRTILNVNLNVDNVFDVRTAQRIYPIYNQRAVAISEERIAQGTWAINDYEPELDPRYLMESDFYGPLTARLGLKFSF